MTTLRTRKERKKQAQAGWRRRNREWELEYYRRNHEKILARDRARRASRPEYYFNQRLLKTFGIDLNDFRAIYAEQRGLCAACRAPVKIGGRDGVYVDHNHATGSIRGLCCLGCNTALGHVRDNPVTLRRLADYIETHARGGAQ